MPFLFLLLCGFIGSDTEPRKTTSLNGDWHFQQETASGGTRHAVGAPLREEGWKKVAVPQAWEHHEGMAFDGVGWYRKELPTIELKAGRRLLLHFDAVATHATVFWNGTKLGEHLGPWTPFRFDVTEEIRKAPKGPHVIEVRVDEKVGHNTQGFLPIIQPHFGGIWQEVKLIEVPEAYLDELRWSSSLQDDQITIKVPFGDGMVERRFPAKASWSPAAPLLQRFRITEGHDSIEVAVALRTIETRGDQFLLNGQPLSIRGVLNWGYYPPNLAPNPDPEVWRKDLRLIKSWGFNLMKCCLWMPPKRFLEIADEEGVLLWIEYPTWHPKLDQQHRADLVREYTEFFHYDRNHPSIILRSLTCETGHQADLAVIQELYDLGKKMIPGALIVDDSSWIEWNRIYDFFDDHPYGNNHTWVPTLKRLKNYIAKKGTKPLVLGEAIAADTWVPVDRLLAGSDETQQTGHKTLVQAADGTLRPYWHPIFLNANRAWLARMEKAIGGPIDQERLRADSLRYAWLMRKYQIETFRREVPNGGYVVSVIRDFPLASMGLIDYEEKPKWEAKDWAWHGEKMLLGDADSRSRTFSYLPRSWLPLRFVREPNAGAAEVILSLDAGSADYKSHSFTAPTPMKPGKAELDFTFPLHVSQFVTSPTRYAAVAVAEAKGDRGVLAANRWSYWLLPAATRPVRARLRPDGNVTLMEKQANPGTDSGVKPLTEWKGAVEADFLTPALMDFLEAGGKVLLLPNGKEGSLPLRSHWFLRGGPFVNTHHPLIMRTKGLHEMLVENQHFDLAGDVIPEVQYLEEIDPILMLWDNHDIPQVETHGLVFETRVGKGRLMVSALHHAGETNAAGRWLIDLFLKHLEEGPPPRNGLKPDTIAGLRAKLREKKLELVGQPWMLKAEATGEAVDPQVAPDTSWKPIKIGQHWEGQGFPTLDGWAWYRLDLTIPADWQGMPIYWHCDGVDDYAEFYVNGQSVGTMGDLANKKTAFEDKATFEITKHVKPGVTIKLAVRVYDWYGAGGCHRPQWLSTVPRTPGPEILK